LVDPVVRIVSHIENDTKGALVVGNNLLDAVSVDKYRCCIWDIVVSNPTTGESGVFTMYGIHNGTDSADATELGSSYDLIGGAVTSSIVDDVQLAVGLSGTGPSQMLQLVAQVTALTGWVVAVHRRPLVGGG
jgi:hypothetical protein